MATAASSISAATSFAREASDAWLASRVTIFLGAIRAAIRSWFSGAIMRSALEIWYQEGLLFQAGLPMASPKVLASGAFW